MIIKISRDQVSGFLNLLKEVSVTSLDVVPEGDEITALWISVINVTTLEVNEDIKIRVESIAKQFNGRIS